MRSTVQVADAPQAVGPYSQAQVVELPGGVKLVYTAGQVAIDPTRGELVQGGVAEQTERVLQNLTAVLAGAGCTLADAVRVGVFLTDMGDFKAMNEIYARHFPGKPPARTTIAVTALPLGGKVEIDVVAVRST